MRLKTFSAPSMPAVLQLVREQMGDDAIILSDREDVNKGLVIVTAGLDEAKKPHGHATPAEDLNTEELADNIMADYSVEHVASILKSHGCPTGLLHRLLNAMGQDDLAAALSLILSFGQPTFEKPLLLVGPAGAGKTLLTARLATQQTLSQQPLSVFSTDVVKAGGLAQLQELLEILKVPLTTAKDTNELGLALRSDRENTQVIDTAGLHPFADDEETTLKTLGTLPVETMLVLPAGLCAVETQDLCDAYKSCLTIDYLTITRLDYTKRLATCLVAADVTEAKFAFTSHTASPAKPLNVQNPLQLATLLLQSADTFNLES